MEYLNKCLVCEGTAFSSIEQTSAMMHPSEESFNFDQCADCGLVFLNPRVPLEGLNAYYTAFYLPYRGAKAWGKYANLVAGDQKTIDQKRIKVLAPYINKEITPTILDVGCGKPSFLKSLASKYACQPIGIDFSDKGWKGDPEEYANLDLRIGDPYSAELPQSDLITMWQYLEHDYAPACTLQRLHSISKKHTRLIIEVPNYDSDTQKKYGAYWAGYHSPRHTALYTPATMKTLLQNNGWQVEKSFTYGSLNPYILDWMSRKERAGIDWSASMEPEFIGFMLGMIRFLPKKWLQKIHPQGFMTVVASPI